MKKISLHFLFILLIITCSFSCSSDNNIPETEQQTIIEPIESIELFNISYGNNSNQIYDIYLPENRTLETKILILVHGGGWVGGDKIDMNTYKDIAKNELSEYAIVNINYRLASQGISPFPMQLDDITSVINHLKLKQNEYIISQDYGFIGVSAGAHLSMLWSYNYDTDDNVNMVASIVGPTNFTDPEYSDLINPAFLYFGVVPSSSFLELYSPFHQANSTSPPTVMFYGGVDELVPTSQGVDMAAKLNQLGVTHEFTLYPNEGHGWVGENLLDTWTKTKAFVLTHH